MSTGLESSLDPNWHDPKVWSSAITAANGALRLLRGFRKRKPPVGLSPERVVEELEKHRKAIVSAIDAVEALKNLTFRLREMSKTHYEIFKAFGTAIEKARDTHLETVKVLQEMNDEIEQLRKEVATKAPRAIPVKRKPRKKK